MLVLRPGTLCQHGRSGCGIVVLVLIKSSASPNRGSSGSNTGRKSVDDLAVASMTMMVEKSVAAGESANGKLKRSHGERGYVQLGKKREVNVSRGCSTTTAHWADLPCAPSLARRNDQGSFENINDGVVHYCEAKRTPWQDNSRVRVKTQATMEATEATEAMEAYSLDGSTISWNTTGCVARVASARGAQSSLGRLASTCDLGPCFSLAHPTCSRAAELVWDPRAGGG
ncbi:hypothetical protein E4U35_007681 [Claviceps purpurea]|nr:hypothetical protein E4U35_007681 [Claviceps purpurea]